jgi:hypothetical protein
MKRLEARPDPSQSFIVFLGDAMRVSEGPLPQALLEWLFILSAACDEGGVEEQVADSARALARSLVTSSDSMERSYTAGLESPLRMKVLENTEKAREATEWDEMGSSHPYRKPLGVLYVFRRPAATPPPSFAANAAYLCPARVWLLLNGPGWRLEVGEDGAVVVVCGAGAPPSPCTARLYVSCLPPLRTLSSEEVVMARHRVAVWGLWARFRQLRVRVEQRIWGVVEAVVEGVSGGPGIKEGPGRAGADGGATADVTYW